LRFGTFLAIILWNILHITLLCIFSPPLMPMIHRFDLLLES
jgi:hypothetical protein